MPCPKAKRAKGCFAVLQSRAGGMGAEQSAEAPTTAPADANPGEASTSTTAAAPPVAELKPLAGPTPVDVEVFKPDEVVAALHAVTDGDRNVAMVEACCKRVRVLCRHEDMCKVCDQAGVATVLVKAMQALPNETCVQLQALAALVNLCSGENSDYRSQAVASGVLPMIVAAMKTFTDNPEVQEMGCIALQNCCYGEDKQAVEHRKEAAAAGAISAVRALHLLDRRLPPRITTPPAHHAPKRPPYPPPPTPSIW